MQQPQTLHFSHRHPLSPTETPESAGEFCSGCELHLSGASYKCTKPTCDFHLHHLCFHLPPEIHHPSHPKHPLSLISGAQYAAGEFLCDACATVGSGFSYHCPRCQFDLHIHCAALPETVDDAAHKHPLTLFFGSSAIKGEGEKSSCGICEEGFSGGCWVYGCRFCEYGVHVDCVVAEEDEEEELPVADDLTVSV